MPFSLTSLSPSELSLALLAVTAAVLLLLLVPGATAGLLRRMARRQIVRRPLQTALMVAGLALGTMFMTAALALQDSFQASFVTARLSQVGNVDEAVTGPMTQAQVQNALSRLRHTPQVQTATALYLSTFATLARAHPRRGGGHGGVGPTNVYIYGVTSGFDAVYGPLIDIKGRPVRVAELRPGQVFLSHQAASAGGIRAGARVMVSWYGITMRARVRAVLSTNPVVTTGELVQDIPVAGVILPLPVIEQAFAKRFHHALSPDTICIKNVGLDDSPSRAVLPVLQHLFGVRPLDLTSNHSTFVPTYFDTFLIHPLKPDAVEVAQGLSPISSKAEYLASPAARQAQWLLPAFTSLLVGASLLLLTVQCLLLAAERRAELGLSRALGLQRRQVVQAMAVEGSGYAILAAALGVPLGAGAVAAELAVLQHLPVISLGPSAPFQFDRIPFHLAIRWQSAVDAACLTLLLTLAVVVVLALWVSRLTIVAAIRDLDDPPAPPTPLIDLVRDFHAPALDADGRGVTETAARRRERRGEAVGSLVRGLIVRGPLCLLVGIGVSLLGGSLGNDTWHSTGVVALIGGTGLLVRWMVTLSSVARDAIDRLGISLLGLGWLVYGLQMGHSFFGPVFAADLTVFRLKRFSSYSLPEILLDLLVPLIGVTILVVRNLDVPARAVSAVLRLIPGVAPVSRIGLVYPLTFRLRAGVTVALVSLITYLVMLLVVNNLSAMGQSQVAGEYTADLTAILASYLALGLIFGAFAIAIITSRSVVERRQQIAMLRAIGYSRLMVRRWFLVESGFVVLLGLLAGAGLAWWIVAQVAREDRQPVPMPIGAVLLLLTGGYLVVLVCTMLPTRQAARLPPAEALRYE